MLSREHAIELLKIYEQAWINQDPELILTIFCKDGLYHERVFDAPYVGHSQIKSYWERKVLGEQEDISFKLLNTYIDGYNVIAEWEASFLDTKQGINKRIREVAILEIREGKIFSLREYWASEHRTKELSRTDAKQCRSKLGRIFRSLRSLQMRRLRLAS